MLDHVSIGVRDLDVSRRFYDAALAPLGMTRLLDFEGRGSGCGSQAAPLGVEFTITREGDSAAPAGFHICFRAPSRAAVDAFFAAALAAGGRDDGGPGLRPHYHESYDAAFVRDPDRYKVEAVCHLPLRPLQEERRHEP